jgi:hypothetical protein
VIAKNLNSQQVLVVIFTISKLLKILKPYTEQTKLGYFDLNLFHGFYSTVPHEEPPEPVVFSSRKSSRLVED